jgi:outer membrane protease
MSARKYLPSFLAVVVTLATPAFAADFAVWPSLSSPSATSAALVPNVDYFTARSVPAMQYEVGGRYWFGNAKTGKSLYGAPVFDGLVSRLTYSSMMTNSAEIYGRMASTYGWFLKGYLGIGAMSRGSLRDEDFPPTIAPYSSTSSQQQGGYLDYASVDVGYNFLRGGDFNLGAFVGYHFFNQVVDAYGCAQTAGSPSVCQPAVPTGIEVISQNNKWQSVRVGLNGSVTFADRFKFSADAAWLPYTQLSGADSHLLRIGSAVGDFTGAIPETGTGQGYQLEAALSYQLTPHTSIGIGGRYWHMETNGSTDFGGRVVGMNAVDQPVSWKTDIYGAFLQASYTFGPYPIN